MHFFRRRGGLEGFFPSPLASLWSLASFPLPLRSVILCFGCFSDFSHNLNDDFSMQVENSFLNENKGCVLSITYVLFKDRLTLSVDSHRPSLVFAKTGRITSSER